MTVGAHRGTENTHGADGSITASEQKRRHQDWLDEQPTTVLCGYCPGWSFTGPAIEARAAAELHRSDEHPDLGNARRRTVKRECKVPGCSKYCKPGSDRCWDHTAVLGEVAADERLGPDAAAASPNTDNERTEMECKVDGCTGDASAAPKTGPTARLCSDHRAKRSAEISAAKTGKPRGGAGVSLGGGNRSRQKRAAPARRPRKKSPTLTEAGPTVTKAEALLAAARGVDEAEKILEQARAQLKEAADELAA